MVVPLLTHWGQAMYICVSKLPIFGWDNGLSPGRRQAIIWTNAGLLSIGPLGTEFSEISIEIYTFSFMKMHRKMAAILSQPQCVNAIRPEQNGCHVVGNIGSGKGMLPDNTKPLHGPMLIKFCNIVWFYLAKISLILLSFDPVSVCNLNIVTGLNNSFKILVVRQAA